MAISLGTPGRVAQERRWRRSGADSGTTHFITKMPEHYGSRLRFHGEVKVGDLVVAGRPPRRRGLRRCAGVAAIGLGLVAWYFMTRTDRPQQILRGDLRGNVVALTFAPDGKTLASGVVTTFVGDAPVGSGTVVELWDVRHGRLLKTLRGRNGELKCIAFSPNGRVLAGASDGDGSSAHPPAASYILRLWDVHSGALLRVIAGSSASIRQVAFRPNKSLVVTDTNGTVVNLGHTQEPGQLVHTLTLHDDATVYAAAFSPDTSLLACSTWEHQEVPIIHVWNTVTGRLLWTLRGHVDMASCLTFSHNSHLLASGITTQSPNPAEVKVWDMATGRLKRTFNGNRLQVSALAFSPDDGVLATGGADRTVRLWGLGSGRLRRSMSLGFELKALAFANDGKTLAAGGADAAITLWSLK